MQQVVNKKLHIIIAMYYKNLTVRYNCNQRRLLVRTNHRKQPYYCHLIWSDILYIALER